MKKPQVVVIFQQIVFSMLVYKKIFQGESEITFLKSDFELENNNALDFDFKKLQCISFWIDFFTIWQSFYCKKHNALDFDFQKNTTPQILK